ncbi:MAG: hypothetical protein KatS3mg077_0623 [Candidatus Binatia bacterium]|nr:MAG: hypothetical protein KatS3mg077_0623 [Candidatus Binatia bacterium]
MRHAWTAADTIAVPLALNDYRIAIHTPAGRVALSPIAQRVRLLL